MKTCGLILILAVFCFANFLPKIDYIDGESNYKPSSPPAWDRVLIDGVGDIRAIMWSGGKSIAVSANGDAIAVIYGAPTTSTDNPMAIKVAYSLDDGATWTPYGPFSGELRRIYPGMAGMPTFDTGYGELYFTWQESQLLYLTGDQKVMIEEGNPAASSFSVPQSLPNADVIFPWLLSIAVAPDDYEHVVATGWSYLDGGNQNLYCWVSEDGGYTWSDSINLIGGPISTAGGSGPIGCGTGDYVFYSYLDLYDIGGGDSIAYPYFIESTDGGYTWSAPEALPVPYATAASSFWWHEVDGNVFNDEPWLVYHDISAEDSMWVFHGVGSPGSWTWEVYEIHGWANCSTYVGDTLYYSYPAQYPSISYDDVSGTVLVSYKAYYYVGDEAGTWSYMDGAHVGGAYSSDNGATWTLAYPLSTLNTGEIPEADWSATETAHMLENDGGDIYAHTVWLNELELNIYYEGGSLSNGLLQPFVGIAEMGSNSISSYNFSVAPTVASHYCTAAFTMPTSGNVALKLFDVTGRLVRTAFNGQLDKGAQRIDINTSGLTNGAYFIILETTTGNSARKLIKL